MSEQEAAFARFPVAVYRRREARGPVEVWAASARDALRSLREGTPPESIAHYQHEVTK
jgi:hypothetical protein